MHARLDPPVRKNFAYFGAYCFLTLDLVLAFEQEQHGRGRSRRVHRLDIIRLQISSGAAIIDVPVAVQPPATIFDPDPSSNRA